MHSLGLKTCEKNFKLFGSNFGMSTIYHKQVWVTKLIHRTIDTQKLTSYPVLSNFRVLSHQPLTLIPSPQSYLVLESHALL